ncbi:hypothetical protein [Sphingomonas hankookensis]|uniref:hypothetical protein n=1 Tax=Sphingomonas hankookensis TaxID=563996 RepID=UPI00234E87F8|nr:hypothetical protein [Sphingomonas hankookensis]WCP71536.1 hypothetical protein PPZ50_14425 [Sphingomonas hankookensis]
MAKAHIVVSRTSARADTGATLPVPDAVPLQAMTVGSAASSSVVATFGTSWSYQVCHITALGGPLWLAFSKAGGPDPEAGEGNGWLIQDGESRSFGVVVGQKLAIRDAVL